MGIINPPASTERDLIKYPKDKTIIYEIKSGGKVGEQIHFFFFSRMSTGAVTFPIKLADALNLYGQNKGFCKMSIHKQQEFMMPFKTMDLMEAELKNLDIVNTSDQMSNSMKIVRRSNLIQKDFFSMAEYLIWATNQYFELDYYKKRSRRNKSGPRQLIFIN